MYHTIMLQGDKNIIPRLDTSFTDTSVIIFNSNQLGLGPRRMQLVARISIEDYHDKSCFFLVFSVHTHTHTHRQTSIRLVLRA